MALSCQMDTHTHTCIYITCQCGERGNILQAHLFALLCQTVQIQPPITKHHQDQGNRGGTHEAQISPWTRWHIWCQVWRLHRCTWVCIWMKGWTGTTNTDVLCRIKQSYLYFPTWLAFFFLTFAKGCSTSRCWRVPLWMQLCAMVTALSWAQIWTPARVVVHEAQFRASTAPHRLQAEERHLTGWGHCSALHRLR